MMGKFAVGSAWHCTGPSLDESLSSPRFRLLDGDFVGVGRVRRALARVDVFGRGVAFAGFLVVPLRGRRVILPSPLLVISRELLVGNGGGGGGDLLDLGLGRTSTPAMAASCARSRSPRSLSSPPRAPPRALGRLVNVSLFEENSTARADAVADRLHTR